MSALADMLAKANEEVSDGSFVSRNIFDETWMVLDRVGGIGADQIAQVYSEERAKLIANLPELARLVLAAERICGEVCDDWYDAEFTSVRAAEWLNALGALNEKLAGER
jgi:hypothetical protein